MNIKVNLTNFFNIKKINNVKFYPVVLNII